MANMYERFFTDRARKVMQFANQEARRLNHEYIGTEHILLGLLRDDTGTACKVLTSLGVDLNKVRMENELILLAGPDTVAMGRLPQTPRAKRCIEFAIEEARSLCHDHVGTEHLLLGLLREEEGIAAQVLMNFGLKLDDVRAAILNFLEGNTIARISRREVTEEEIRDLPDKIRKSLEDLNTELEQLNDQKVTAVAELDFERAAHLRIQTDRLKKQRTNLIRHWRISYEVDPVWLSWNEGAVARIVKSIAEEQQWEELPILADALEEAGCTNTEILDHCRKPGNHGSNCWVVTLLLSKT